MVRLVLKLWLDPTIPMTLNAALAHPRRILNSCGAISRQEWTTRTDTERLVTLLPSQCAAILPRGCSFEVLMHFVGASSAKFEHLRDNRASPTRLPS